MNSLPAYNPHCFSVAPMMGYSHHHARVFWRMLSPHALLYTEMLNEKAVYHYPLKRLTPPLDHTSTVLQVGGNTPQLLAHCTRVAHELGYSAINLNVGCPSKQVKNGAFGAILFKAPDKVATCIQAMREAVPDFPVSIKTRIGVDDMEHIDHLINFVETTHQAGCNTFVVHARKAWLNGLSPSENRTVPPINYSRVYQLKQHFPHLDIIVNGDIQTIDECKQHLRQVDGVMMGRHICKYPLLLHYIEQSLFNAPENTTFDVAFKNYMHYAEEQIKLKASIHLLTQPLQHIFFNQEGSKAWRNLLHNFTRHKKIDLLFNDIKQKITAEFFKNN